MDAAKALAFARKNPHAVLATMKRDSTPQLSPVLVGVDSQDRLVVSTRETAMKTLNVRRDPRAWLCVLNDRFFGDWAQLSGDVEVVSLPEAMEPLVEYYRSISGEHPDWDDYRTAMIKQRRCLIRITPTKAGPTVAPSQFVPLYRTDDEFAAELSNRTIHAVMHLAWAEQASGDYQGQMAV